MDSELYEAAMKGDVPSLLELLTKDKLLLDRIMVGNHTETPLHIAAMLGHLEFVEAVLARKTELARVQDSQGLTPLHLAAAKGYLNIVASLLRVSPELCFFRDKHERNPLHVAAMKGHVDVLECLVRARPDAARSVIEHGQTILHLCVKHNRQEALKLLIDILGNDQFINSCDEYGNTILHLAAADRQAKTIVFLTNKGVNPNLMNSKGFTALSLLAQGESMERASEIMGSVPRTSENCNPSRRTVHADNTTLHPPVGEENKRERKRKWQNSMHKTLMVVAAVVATMAFQARMDPPDKSEMTPPGISEMTPPDKSEMTSPDKSEMTPPGISDGQLDDYKAFIACNTVSFVASLSVILLLISGLPLKRRRITTWIAMLTMWVAINFTAATYAISFTQKNNQVPTNETVRWVVLTWVGLMQPFLLLCHFLRLILKLVRKVLKFIRKALTKRKPKDLTALSQEKCTEP